MGRKRNNRAMMGRPSYVPSLAYRAILSARDEVRLSCHHLIPRARLGSDDEHNLVLVPRAWHCKWHLTFGLATPDEAVTWLVGDDKASPVKVWRECSPTEVNLRGLFPDNGYSRERLASYLERVLSGGMRWSDVALRQLVQDL